MSDDIVTRLREAGECPTPLRAYLARAVVLQAADEIDDLRFQLEGTKGELENALSRERTLLKEQEDCRIGNDNLHAEIERLRAERNNARKWICEIIENPSLVGGLDRPRSKEDVAREQGWDCFKGVTND